MNDLKGCQIPCLPYIAEGFADIGSQPLDKRLKRLLAKVWNHSVKRILKRGYEVLGSLSNWRTQKHPAGEITVPMETVDSLEAGDMVHVRSQQEIWSTLDPWKELKGCAFLESMWQYCETTQRVLTPLERFLDERDYKVKKVKGVVLLEGVICRGTPVFGRCDRCCHLFWRVEWLEEVSKPAV